MDCQGFLLLKGSGVTNTEPPTDITFGPNEWLVDELFRQYKEDPDSVDPAWWEFFADYRPSNYREVRDEALTHPATLTDTETGESRQDGRLAAEAEPSAPVEPGRAAEPPTAVSDTSGPTAPADTHEQMSTDLKSEPPAPHPTEPPPLSLPKVEPLPPTAATLSIPKITAPPASVSDTDEAPLRGAAARVVSNMETSLTVPTATSVRAVPAQLLVDNRREINNRLRRGRGGKVSLTHLIAFAIVKALKEREDRDLRVETAVAAGLLSDSGAVKELVKVLTDPKASQFVLGSVALALGQIGDHEAIKPLVRILEPNKANGSYPDLTRALVAVSLGQIANRRDLRVLYRISKDINYRASVSALDELLTIL